MGRVENAKNTLGFYEKFSYALGDTASNFFFQFFAIFIVYYYTDVYGLNAAAVTTMLLVVKLWDWISDPIMGVIADRTNTRWGNSARTCCGSQSPTVPLAT